MKRLLLPCLAALVTLPTFAQNKPDTPINDRIANLRSLHDDQRGKETGDIALAIRALPPSEHKVQLALTLAHLATEGDPGRDNLQAVTITLSSALLETPAKPDKKGDPNGAYVELAELGRYEGMKMDKDMLNNDQLKQAAARLVAEDAEIEKQDFTLKDLKGKKWTLSQLRGKIVMVNFWGTWCQSCRKEMSDLDLIQSHFESQGLVILGLDDENAFKIDQFFHGHYPSYPILLDDGRKIADAFHVQGIPRSFVFNREGKLVAESIDMRTQRQFLQMLAAAGLKPQ